MGQTERWHIVFFSGTGGTELCARKLRNELDGLDLAGQLYSLGPVLGEGTGILKAAQPIPEGNVILLYPVYAASMPALVRHWLKALPPGSSCGKAAVLSVSGGGNLWPNNDSRRAAKRLLARAGYRCAYEDMLVMPANWTVPTPPALLPLLYEATGRRLARIVLELRNGTERHDGLALGSALISWVSRLEQLGSIVFGRRIQVGTQCNACLWCAKHCPVGNITRGKAGRPVYGSNCLICMRCLYGCPQDALRPGFLRFFRIPEGFSLLHSSDELSRLLMDAVLRPQSVSAAAMEDRKKLIAEHARGLVWLGLRRYLEQD